MDEKWWESFLAFWQEYLRKYGYIIDDFEDDAMGAMRDPARLIKTFQDFAGLPQTGNLLGPQLDPGVAPPWFRYVHYQMCHICNTCVIHM